MDRPILTVGSISHFPAVMADTIQSPEQLEDRLSEPTPEVVQTLRRLEGDLIVLGVAGKMGPNLARMARRAADLGGSRRRVIGVARFSSAGLEAELQRHGIETIRCDLFDEEAVLRLPDAPNVLYLAGMKFGASGQESLTWAMNTHLPAIVCRKFARSRIVAFSTGNVYGLVKAAGGGSLETDPPAPMGEYAMSCLGRERIFEHFSRTLGARVAIVRLNYACDLRYGVLVALARKVLRGTPADLGMGWFNTLWQGDANAMTLRCFDHVASPPLVLNLTGPDGGRDRVEIAHVHRGVLQAPQAVDLRHQIPGPAVDVVRYHDVGPGPAQRLQHGGDRGHAGGHRRGRCPALQRGQARL